MAMEQALMGIEQVDVAGQYAGNAVGQSEPAGFANGIIVKIKTFLAQFDLQQWLEEMKNTPAGLAVLCFAAGFAIGFLFKKYFKFLFWCIFVNVLILFFLHLNNVIVFDWSAMYRVVGIDPAQMQMETMVGTYWQWLRDHLLVSIASVVGFIVGYKLG